MESLEFITPIDTKLLLFLSKRVKLQNSQLRDGFSFQWREQPSSTEEAVLNDGQALQDVIPGRKIQTRFTGALGKD